MTMIDRHLADERTRIAPKKLAHIVLRTTNAERLVDWYKTVLEAEIVMSNGMLNFLTYDEEHHRIAIVQIPGLSAAPPMSIGLDHIAFTYSEASELFSTYDRLERCGILPYWTINHGPTLSFYYRDPDGNQVELQIDLQPDAAATAAWFEQSDFQTNPLGVRIDPANIIARFRSGESEEELFRRPVIDPAQVMAQLPETMFAATESAPPPPPSAASPVPGAGEVIDGKWRWTITGPMGERSGIVTFVHRGGMLEGQWEGQMHNQPIARGSWTGGVARWELDIEQPVKATITIEAVLANGELTGKATMGIMGESAITLTRIGDVLDGPVG